MAQASAHDKQMENLMRTEIFMLCIENRQFQCVDNAARRVDKPAGQQPEKGAFRKCQHDLPEGQHTDPAHQRVQYSRLMVLRLFIVVPMIVSLNGSYLKKWMVTFI